MLNIDHIRRTLRMHFWTVLLIFSGLSGQAAEATGASQFNEHEVKAVFLYNLTNFISWPPPALAGPQKEFRIAIFGPDPFGALLDEIVKGEKVMGRYPIVIQRTNDIDQLGGCHLLYVSNADRSQWARILSRLGGQPVVTVSGSGRFIHNGGMISLVRKDQRIQIAINAKLMKHNGFSVSAKLLKLSTVIEN